MSSGLLSLTFLVACATDPRQAAATRYLQVLQPLMLENSMLADRVLVQAAAVYNESGGPKQVADAWEGEIVPLAEHLADQASLVQPPTDYAARHGELVTIWVDRAAAYRALSEAIRSGEAEAWNPARRDAESAKIREENWFNQLNETVTPLGIPLVDQYP